MDSDKAVCVRLEAGDAKSVQIISLATGGVLHKFPMGAESAILCPDGKSIAVRQGTALQVFNLELQKKTKCVACAGFRTREGVARCCGRGCGTRSDARVSNGRRVSGGRKLLRY